MGGWRGDCGRGGGGNACYNYRMHEVRLTVSEFNAICNQTLEYAFSAVTVEGEVASFKINQEKYVFFDLKDDACSVGCFMMRSSLRFGLEDGMKIVVRAVPKLTKWGKFSLTVLSMMPVGEGSLKKNFELLKKRLAKDGLFDESRKRGLPDDLSKIGVISSTEAAGYKDFCKILDERWGGLELLVAHTQVQGMSATDQIIRALRYFNERGEMDVIAIIRGGGSADDLGAFNDEALVREIAGSKIPVIVGIGHEVDESLADLAADVRASTPSNAAQMLTRDKKAEMKKNEQEISRLRGVIEGRISDKGREVVDMVGRIKHNIDVKITTFGKELANLRLILEELNPNKVLERGYALIAGELEEGNVVKITTVDKEVIAEVKNVTKRINK